MINLRKTLTESHQILEARGVAHALIGGFALATYGQHRATFDIDFLADGSQKKIIKDAFLNQGFSVKFESDDVLQFSGLGYVDIVLANRPLSQEMLKQAVLNQNLGVYVLRPEDIIGLKIQAYKNERNQIMTLDEYFEFLEQYWLMFPPPTEPKKKVIYKNILL